MKMNKNIIAYIFSICLIYFLFILSFYIILYFDKNFLFNLFNKFDVYKNLPFEMTKETAKQISNELMNYLKGTSNFLNTKITINGIEQELYSLKAKIHMNDVRNIFIINIKLHYIAFIICVVCIYLFIKKNINLNTIFISYKNIVITLLIFLILIIFYAIIDFNSFFLNFHKLFFNNDYFLFDPKVDYIILMLPEELFQYVGMICISLFISLNFIVLILLRKH